MDHHGNVIISFKEVEFEYTAKKPVLNKASFTIRKNAKITIMGQNGAGKSTIFKLITGELVPQKGSINIEQDASIGIALQVMPEQFMDKTVTEFFETAFDEKIYDIDRRVAKMLDVVNLVVPTDRLIKNCSGGQQARLLLAYALINEPDILLLDEPTNNLDSEGIGHLISFLLGYEKTVVVISHDADFLNMFTDGVLHLDAFTKTTQQFVGDYYDVVEEISAQIERDKRKNAQLKKNIADRKAKVNQFSHKGGKMRKLASKMKEEIEDDEDNMVSVRQEDKTIKPFTIPVQDISGVIATLEQVSIMNGLEPTSHEVNIELRRGDVLRITGPNGIGKTTMLEALASQAHTGMNIKGDAKVGYYRQDFSGLDFSQNSFQSLEDVKEQGEGGQQEIYNTAAQFLITGDLLNNQIGSLSEGQKGLLSYARFVLQRPALLILDEPTNHINFRHLPVVAEALNSFEGAIILVSHDDEFVDKLNVTQTLELERFLK